jgi:Fe-S cluster assembly protein SufD
LLIKRLEIFINGRQAMITINREKSELERKTEAGPAWLDDLRSSAWEKYRSAEFPTGHEELWRYTDLSFLDLDQYRITTEDIQEPVDLPERAKAALKLKGAESSGEVVHMDRRIISKSLSDEAKRQGVIFTDLGSAIKEHESLVRSNLAGLIGASDLFTSRNLALHQGGTFLYVPEDVKLEAPLNALFWLNNAEGTAIYPRILAVVERGAKVIFNDIYASGPLEKPALVNPVTEVYIGPEAEVGWMTWQDWGPGVRHLAQAKARLAENAKLDTLQVTLGADYSRTWKECLLTGQGAESIMLGLYFPKGDQKFEHWTLQDHAAPKTKSDLLYKGALDDTSRAVYYGTIKVRKDARGADAYQANRNLTLSPRARADTNPQLEIENNDVRCTHGATVGRVNEEQLFYLMSRGLERGEAERLLISGFFNEVLARVKWPGMNKLLVEAVLDRLEA